MLGRLGMKEGEAIVHPWVNKALEKAQGKVEARNFDIRKNLLKFDDVMNDQRKAIFAQRREIMESHDLSDVTRDMRQQVVDDLVAEHVPARAYADQWDIDGLTAQVKQTLGLDLPLQAWADEEGVDDELIRERLQKAADELMAGKAARYGAETMRAIEKQVLLQTIDQNWRDHLVTLDHLRSVVGFRGYAQRDPLNEYKSEAFQLFESLLDPAQGRGHPDARPRPGDDPGGAAGDGRRAAGPRPGGAGRPGPPPGPGRAARPGACGRRRARRRRRPRRPRHLGRQRPQRPLPLRLGQEVQALPRQGLRAPVTARHAARVCRPWCTLCAAKLSP